MRAQKCVCACLSERVTQVAILLKMCRNNIFHISFWKSTQRLSWEFISFKKFIFLLMTLSHMLAPLASSCTTGTHLLQLCFGPLVQYFQAAASGLDLTRESCLMEDQPDAAVPLPPRPQWPHCLHHINKLAGPPRFEAALCYCRGWEAHTNSHIQNDMISQLEARARQEISTVR